jgi:hypothetical protein
MSGHNYSKDTQRLSLSIYFFDAQEGADAELSLYTTFDYIQQ